MTQNKFLVVGFWPSLGQKCLDMLQGCGLVSSWRDIMYMVLTVWRSSDVSWL